MREENNNDERREKVEEILKQISSSKWTIKMVIGEL
jgi:hypothetical protein